MSLRESLNELLEVEDRLSVAELENKALRFQTEKQAEMIRGLNDELRFYRRFRQLVERAATIVNDVPKMKEDILSRKHIG